MKRKLDVMQKKEAKGNLEIKHENEVEVEDGSPTPTELDEFLEPMTRIEKKVARIKKRFNKKKSKNLRVKILRQISFDTWFL